MFNYSNHDLATIDKTLEPLLARAKDHAAQTEQLAMDATRLLSVREDQLAISAKQPFFQRLAQRFTGQTAANVTNLYEMQRIGWRYIQILNERDLMMAHSMITVKNNLMTLAVKETETRQMLTLMANRIADRFETLEQRVGTIETQQNIHSWLLTLDTYDYPDKYPEKLRLLRIVKDFFQLKQSAWNFTEIKYLQKALKEAELPWREAITLADFIDDLIDEIEAQGFNVYDQLITLNNLNGRIEHKFILENISAPSHKSLYKIADNYDASSDMIDLLADQLSISKKDAMKKVLRGFIEKEGIDTTIKIPMRDLAVELLGCHGLVMGLLNPSLPNNVAVSTTLSPAVEQKQIGKFIVQDDVAIDTETHLMWCRYAVGQSWQAGQVVGEVERMMWDKAMECAEAFNKNIRCGGFSDWRLPTIDELKSLIDNNHSPTINPTVFPNTPKGGFFNFKAAFWSSSPYVGGPSYAWSVNFFNGYVNYYLRSNALPVRLVRASQ